MSLLVPSAHPTNPGNREALAFLALLALLLSLMFLPACVVRDPEGKVDHEATRELNESIRQGLQSFAEIGMAAAGGGAPRQPGPAMGAAPCPSCGGQGMVVCPACQGQRGFACTACGGTGWYFGRICPQCMGRRGFPCMNCQGAGGVPCPACQGTGQLRR